MSVTVTGKDLFAEVQNIIDAHNNDEHDLLGILLETQEIVPQQYISKEVAKFISEKLSISNNDVCEVVTFYSALSDKPRGRHIIQICNSTACMVNKYRTLRDILEKQLGIKVGETTADNKFTLMYTPCFGACDIAPAFRIGEEVYGNLDEEKIKKIIENYGGM
jgi:NADH:ubiquinone oxidoreductase subunit E